MIVEIKVPEVGESITEGVLVEWLQEEGAVVGVDDPLFELETDKITLTVAAEQSGKLSIGVEPDSTVQVGQVVGTLDTEAAGEVPAGGGAPTGGGAVTEPEPEPDTDELSPAVRRLVSEHGVDPAKVKGTGPGGRVTKGDVLAFVEKPVAKKMPVSVAAAPKPPSTSTSTGVASGERETRTRMSSLRRRLAQRLVEVQQEAAILTTFNEVDMSAVMELRARFKEEFLARHGVKLGFMSFFVKAVVEALKAVPRVNARIEGDEIVTANYYDIGVAVSSASGLVVPVVRGADQLGFAGVEQAIGELAARARDKRLTLDDLSGGTFTISNGGIYGSLLSTPILNPPQSAILGMHGIKRRPIAVGVGADERMEIRPMMNLAVSYDHRLIDGSEAVVFLRRIVAGLEAPERLLLEV